MYGKAQRRDRCACVPVARRASDHWNLGVSLTPYLSGLDPREAYARALKDLKHLGFAAPSELAPHLNGRQQSAKEVWYEIGRYMTVVELSRRRGDVLEGFVRTVRRGRGDARADIQLTDPYVSVHIQGSEAQSLSPMQKVKIRVRAATPGRLDPWVEIVND